MRKCQKCVEMVFARTMIYTTGLKIKLFYNHHVGRQYFINTRMYFWVTVQSIMQKRKKNTYFTLLDESKSLNFTILFWAPSVVQLLTVFSFCYRRLYNQRGRLSWRLPAPAQPTPRPHASLPFPLLPPLPQAPPRALPPTAGPPGLRPRRRRERRLRQRRETRPHSQPRQAKEKNTNGLLAFPSVPTRIHIWHEEIP